MTHPIVTADPGLLKRVRDSIKPGSPLADAIRDAAARLGIDVPWHEADVLAEALRHQHDQVFEVYRVVHPGIGIDMFRETEGKYLRRELVEAIDNAGMALVEEPVETVHAVSDLAFTPRSELHLRKSPPLSEEQAKEITARHPEYFPLVVLTGRARRLATA
jgi:hypothetical protein